MYGVQLSNGRRPASKKAIKEALGNGHSVYLDNTSMFGGASGSTATLPVGVYTFVGPDPYTKRSFYGNITITDKAGVRVVKVS
jgi:hypothetical protein